MTTFVALGDSITLGVGDPVRVADPETGRSRRAWRGWAALLAEGLCDPELHIVAGNGACSADVERDQLPRALQLRPDIASVVVGINDTLRPNFDPARIEAAAAHTIGALRAAGAEVLTLRLPDPGRMLGAPSFFARPLARRARQINTVMDGLAGRFGTVHFDAASDEVVYDKRMWAVDRLHPSERGHRYIAGRFHQMLAAKGFALGPEPDPEPGNRPPTKAAQFAWMATKGTAWVVRRSTDLVPNLLALAYAEWRAGPEADPDEQTGLDLAKLPGNALAVLTPSPALSPSPAPRSGAPLSTRADQDLVGTGPVG